MRLQLNYCRIVDVDLVDPKQTDGQRKNRRVLIDIDEEDFFKMLDNVNQKNIVKYLDMRKINHRDSLNINVTSNKVVLVNGGGKSKRQEAAMRGLYNANKTANRKLNRALEILDSMRENEKL